MALKDTWKDKIDGVDEARAEDINKVARAVIEVEDSLKLATPFATPQMFGAKGDGKTDDTEAIQTALNAASLEYIPDGTYMINATNSGWGHQYEGGVKPKSNQTIILSQNAAL